MYIGKVIKNYRKTKGIQSVELSKMIGKSGAYISQIESGKNKNPDVLIVNRIYEILDIPNEVINMVKYSFDSRDDNFIQTEYLNQEQLDEFNCKLKDDALQISFELQYLNRETKKHLISLLQAQLEEKQKDEIK